MTEFQVTAWRRYGHFRLYVSDGDRVATAIVFVGAKRFTLKSGGPRDIAVLPNARALRRWLRRRGKVLDSERVSALYDLARRPSTWQR